MSTVTATKPAKVATQRIKPTEVLALLKKGYTRYAKDDKGYGSIQEKYGLTGLAIQKLFKTPSLKNRKTIVPDFILDEADEVEKLIEEAEGQDAIPLSEILGRDVIAEEAPKETPLFS